MKTLEVALTPIGNSKGIRLPVALLKKYGITDVLLLEQRPDEIVLRTKRRKKLSFRETFEEMAREKEDWSGFEVTGADGLNED